jgi:FkbM family methyltransferase
VIVWIPIFTRLKPGEASSAIGLPNTKDGYVQMSFFRSIKQRLLRLSDGAPASAGTRFYSQTGEDAILAHLLFDQDSGFYVDVGAFHPIKYSNTYYFYRRGWTGINIEPTPGQIDLFRRERPRDINLAFAVGRASGPICLTTFDDPAVNSADKHMIDRHINTGRFHPTGEISVEAYPLAEILETYMPPGKALTFLSVDVEGMELEVLQSHDWDRFRARFIAVEWVEPLSAKSAISSGVHRFLDQHKYELICKTPATLIFCEREIADAASR